ncbi:MAG: 50S ribosomal protein L34e [Candidatus Methanofastidiosia archaeon]
MVRGMYRSRSLKRKFTRVPGGKSVIHYERGKTSPHKCGNCGALLSGIPRGTPHQISKLAKSQKTVSRPYGGYLCSSCVKNMIKEKVRAETDK